MVAIEGFHCVLFSNDHGRMSYNFSAPPRHQHSQCFHYTIFSFRHLDKNQQTNLEHKVKLFIFRVRADFLYFLLRRLMSSLLSTKGWLVKKWHSSFLCTNELFVYCDQWWEIRCVIYIILFSTSLIWKRCDSVMGEWCVILYHFVFNVLDMKAYCQVVLHINKEIAYLTV